MTRMENVRDFLAQKRFAMVGVSRQPKDFSRALFREFQTRHYQPVPVHPDVTEIEGVRCFAHLRDIQPPVDSVLLMTSPTVTDVVVRECVEASSGFGSTAAQVGAHSPRAPNRCARPTGSARSRASAPLCSWTAHPGFTVFTGW